MTKASLWYRREGYVQFMLGNQWNCCDMRNEGRLILVFNWVFPVACTVLVYLTT